MVSLVGINKCKNKGCVIYFFSVQQYLASVSSLYILIVLFSFWLFIGLFILNDEIYYDEDSRLQTLDSIKYLMHQMYLNMYYNCIEFGNFTKTFEILHQITSTFYLFSNFQFVDMLKLTINLAAHYSTYRDLTWAGCSAICQDVIDHDLS